MRLQETGKRKFRLRLSDGDPTLAADHAKMQLQNVQNPLPTHISRVNWRRGRKSGGSPDLTKELKKAGWGEVGIQTGSRGKAPLSTAFSGTLQTSISAVWKLVCQV